MPIGLTQLAVLKVSSPRVDFFCRSRANNGFPMVGEPVFTQFESYFVSATKNAKLSFGKFFFWSTNVLVKQMVGANPAVAAPSSGPSYTTNKMRAFGEAQLAPPTGQRFRAGQSGVIEVT